MTDKSDITPLVLAPDEEIDPKTGKKRKKKKVAEKILDEFGEAIPPTPITSKN